MIRLLPVLLILFAAILPASAQEAEEASVLKVGTKVSPPFSMKGADGEWVGISIELWKSIANRLERNYAFEERDLEGLIDGVQNGTLDLSIAAISITPERETRLDFSNPYFSSGLGIAVTTRESGWLDTVGRILSLDFLKALGILLVVLLAAGLVVWLFERRRNAQQFDPSPIKGIGAGFWWSAVTMTTVGYGDKAPITFGGRLIALIWMFVAIMIISSFTAAITTALTVNRLEGSVQGIEDLPKVRTATIEGSSSSEFLQAHGIPYRAMENVEAALSALAEGRLDAVVYDRPLLSYLVLNKYPGELAVLPGTIDHQLYAIALSTGSPLREPINRALLEIVETMEWEDVRTRFLGAE